MGTVRLGCLSFMDFLAFSSVLFQNNSGAGVSLTWGARFFYMVCIFAVEYMYGVVFNMAGLRIWDYSNYAWNLHGHITLVYTPFWFFLALWLEYLHKKLDACAVVMAAGYSADDILADR